MDPRPHYDPEIIVVSPGPHVADPTDQAPVLLHVVAGSGQSTQHHAVKLAKRGFWLRLGVWALRRAVRQIMAANGD